MKKAATAKIYCPACGGLPTCSYDKKCEYCVDFNKCDAVLRQGSGKKDKHPPSHMNCFRCKHAKAGFMEIICKRGQGN